MWADENEIPTTGMTMLSNIIQIQGTLHSVCLIKYLRINNHVAATSGP